MEFPWLAIITLVVGAMLVLAIELTDKSVRLVSLSDVRRVGERGSWRARVIERILSDKKRWSITTALVMSIGMILAGVGIMQVYQAGVRSFVMLSVAVGGWFLIASLYVMGRALAALNPLDNALRMSGFAQVVFWIFRPATALLRQIVLVVGTVADEEDAILLSDDGVRLMISSDGEQTEIEQSEQEMITSILEMDDTVAREVMVPRIDITSMDAEASIEEALSVIIDAGHSRIPVYEDDIDHVVGLLYAKDLLKCFQQNRSDASIRSLLRPAHFVPLSKNVKVLLAEMRKHRVHIAIVVDEYGGTAGLVTIEDILEEIVGEIQDEYDSAEAALVQPLGQNAYLIGARLDIYSLSKLLSVDFDDEDADTLGGLVFSQLGHVPQQGEFVECDGWRFTVVAVDGRRIDQVRVESMQSLNAEDVGVPTEHASQTSERQLLRLSTTDS